jgi:hypothetical protein
MDRATALRHLIWREENLRLFKPAFFNLKRLNKFKRELQELEKVAG